MTSLNQNPDDILEGLVNKNIKLQIIEYVSAALAVGGTIAAAMTELVVLAAAPLTLSVILNLFNRRQLDQLTRQHTFADTTEMQRRLSTEIQALRTQVQNLPEMKEAADFNDINATLASLSERTSVLEAQGQDQADTAAPDDLGALQDEIAQLRNHQLDLAQSLESVNHHISNLPTVASTPELEQDLAALKDAIAQLEQRSDSPVNDQVADNLESFRAELQAMLIPVQGQVSALAEKVQGQPTTQESPSPVQVEQVEQIQGQVNELKVTLEQALAQLSAEIAGFGGAVETTQGEIQGLQQQLSGVQQQVTEVADPQKLENLHQQMQSTVTPLQTWLSALDTKLKNLPVVDATTAQAQVEQVQHLQSQLEALGSRLEQVSNQVETELANLPHLVEQNVHTQVDQLKPPVVEQPSKTEAVSELDSILADLGN